MHDYRTVDTTTIKGIEAAERLQRYGWTMIRVGLFSTQFESPLRVRKGSRLAAKLAAKAAEADKYSPATAAVWAHAVGGRQFLARDAEPVPATLAEYIAQLRAAYGSLRGVLLYRIEDGGLTRIDQRGRTVAT